MKKIISSILFCLILMLTSFNHFANANNIDNSNIINASYSLITEVFDYGQQVNKIIIDSKTTISAEELNKKQFSVIAKNELNGQVLEEANRKITNAYISNSPTGEASSTGQYIVLELEYGADVVSAGTVYWDFQASTNYPLDLKYNVIQLEKIHDIYGNQLTPTNFKLSMSGVTNLLVDDFKSGTSTSGLNYRYFEPQTDNKQNPLIIWLHGVGEGGLNNSTQISATRGAVAFIEDDVQEKFDGAYVIAPQCPSFWMPSFFIGDKEIIGDKDYTPDVISLIKEFINNNPDIDPTRVYIGGGSMGGYQTLKTIISAPELFSGAFPICPAYEPSNAELRSLGNLPIWFTHGKNDPIVPYTNSLNAYNYLNQISDNVHYSEYENVIYDGITYFDHLSWIYVLNNAPINNRNQHIFEWLSKQINKDGHRWES